MVPGRCLALGGSRRLSMHSTALPRKPLSPCLLLHLHQFSVSHLHESTAARSGWAHGSALVCTTRATADATCGAGVNSASARSASDAPAHGAVAEGPSDATASTSSSSGRTEGANGYDGSSRDQRANVRGPDADAASAAAAVTATSPLCSRCLVEDTSPDNWLTPLRRSGSVVALGKFDALHRGHQALATAAAALAHDIYATRCGSGRRAAAGSADGNGTAACAAADGPGDAVLLSFSGMAAVLGWPNRLPLTAPQDRGRVLAGWAVACSASNGRCAPQQCQQQQQQQSTVSSSSTALYGSVSAFESEVAAACTTTTAAAAVAVAAAPPPRLRTMPFSLIRGMSPEQFVALLARDLGAAGVVAGRNYRFGYKAAGDADALVRLGEQYGMRVKIVDLVTLPDAVPASGSVGTSNGVSGCDGRPDAPSLPSSGPAAASGRGTGSGASTAAAVVPPEMFAVASTLDGSVTSGNVSDGAPADGPAAAGGGAAATGAGGGGGGAGRGGAAGTSSRVSSSRIRALLERGEVESVEQLLGRKYRLVCEMAAANLSSNNSSGGNSNSSSVGDVGGVGSGSGCGGVRLTVPCTAYQNEPPANGQYQVLVQLVKSQEVPIGTEEIALSGSGIDAGTDAAVLVPGRACMTVELSDAGLQGDLDWSQVQGGLDAYKEGLMLVDFDACG